MANILLLDDNDVACRAMQGILTRGQHRCVLAKEANEAWRLLHELIKIDLIFLELKLSKGDNGINFIQRLRGDPFLKLLPVVVYTSVNHQDIVKKALSLKIQNYLIKPYRDDAIYHEIEKARLNPWRAQHFEEEHSFCVQMGMKPSDLKKMLHDLRVALQATIEPLQECGQTRNQKEADERIDLLSERAEAAGAWGVVESLKSLKEKVELRNWPALNQCNEELGFAGHLIDCHLDPDYTPAGFYSEQERKEQEEAKVRALWLDADVSQGPLVHASELERKLDEMQAMPVIDTVSAAFLMNADGRAPSLNEVIELVSKDPWLTAQVLITANHLDHDDMTSIEDVRLAVTMIGYVKLTSMAKAMPVVEERHMRVLPFTWAHYWMFQVAVARVARFAATNLEFTDLEPNAHTAGLVHDLGKLLLVKLHPYGFQATANYAKRHDVPISEAEKKYIGWTTREMGDHFARKLGLPGVYCDVIRWVSSPADAVRSGDMVALVALARMLCLQNQIGFSGDPKQPRTPIEDSPAWQVLRHRVFPSFNLKKFEYQTHSFCASLKQELSGHIGTE